MIKVSMFKRKRLRVEEDLRFKEIYDIVLMLFWEV